MRIAHISDLHLSPSSDINLYDSVVTALSKIKPEIDLMVVTGDIADNMKLDLSKSGLKESFRLAKEFFLKIEAACKKIDFESRVFVVPGNHDFRYKGNVTQKGNYQIFNDFFKENCQSRYIKELNLIVGCFDSNTTGKHANFATGHVLRHEFNKFYKKLDEIKKNIGELKFDNTNKIALLHHHPMPVLSSEIGHDIVVKRFEIAKNADYEEMFLILKNSATFMTEMIKNDIKVIFHGHKHYLGVAKTSYPMELDNFKVTGVVSAGSIGKIPSGKEYSFNIVDISKTGQVEVNYYAMSGERSYSPINQLPIVLFNEDEVRSFQYQKYSKDVVTRANKIIIRDVIHPNSGDLDHYVYLKNLSTNNNILTKRDSYFNSSSGLFTEIPKYNVLYPKDMTIEWKPKGSPKDSKHVGKVTYDPPLDKDSSILAECLMKIPNSHSYTIEEREAAIETSLLKDKKEETPNEEILYWEFSHCAPEELIWQVQFPVNIKPQNLRIRITDEHNKEDTAEQKYCRKRFHFLESINQSVLSICYPKIDRYYSLIWNLSEEDELLNRNLSDYQIIKSNNIKSNLLLLKPEDSITGDVKSFLKDLYDKIKNTKVFKVDEDVPLELSISLFDKDKKKLRYVAFFCPKCSDVKSSSIWKWETPIGHPITGLAYKRKQIIFKLYKNKPKHFKAKYSRNSACDNKNNDYLKSFIAIPLFYPDKSEKLIGILELASCANVPLISRIDDYNDYDRNKILQWLSSTSNKKFEEFANNMNV